MIFFRIVGVMVMIFGVIQFLASLVMVLGERGLLRAGGFGEGMLLGILMVLMPGIIVLALGAILFVLAEMADRISHGPRYPSRTPGIYE
ncbi:MAG TPA: hypothetical protein VEL76_36830 [Gemmataceae bacterium]|nr:hypothetical protein [Gemmataceae bacterium]